MKTKKPRTEKEVSQATKDALSELCALGKNCTREDVARVRDKYGITTDDLKDLSTDCLRTEMDEGEFRDIFAYNNAVQITESVNGNKFPLLKDSYYLTPDGDSYVAAENWSVSPYAFVCAERINNVINTNFIDNYIDPNRLNASQLRDFKVTAYNEFINTLVDSLTFKINAIISSFMTESFSRLEALIRENNKDTPDFSWFGYMENAALKAYFGTTSNLFTSWSSMTASQFIDLIFTSSQYTIMDGMDKDANDMYLTYKLPSDLAANLTTRVYSSISNFFFMYLPTIIRTSPIWYVQQLNDLSVTLHDSLNALFRETAITVNFVGNNMDKEYNNAFTVMVDSNSTGKDKRSRGTYTYPDF